MRLPHMAAFLTQVSGFTFDFGIHLTNPNPPFEPCCPEDLLTLYLKPSNSICKRSVHHSVALSPKQSGPSLSQTEPLVCAEKSSDQLQEVTAVRN